MFRLRVASLPVTRCLKVFWMVFVQKRRLSFFHWLIMKGSQSWPDLRSQIYKFWDISFIDTVTNIYRWKFKCDWSFGVAMTSFQTFSEVRSLNVTWWPALEWPGSEILTSCAKKIYKQVCIIARFINSLGLGRIPETIWPDIWFLGFILGARMYIRTYFDYECVPETFKLSSCVPGAEPIVQLPIMVYGVVSVNIGEIMNMSHPGYFSWFRHIFVVDTSLR